MKNDVMIHICLKHLRRCRSKRAQFEIRIRKECRRLQRADKSFSKLYVWTVSNHKLEEYYPKLYAYVIEYDTWIYLQVMYEGFISSAMRVEYAQLHSAASELRSPNAKHQLLSPWHRFIYLMDYELN